MNGFAANGRKGYRKFHPARRGALALAGLASLTALVAASLPARTPKLDEDTSRAAFLQVYRVLTSPRCQNCHPADDAPLQGDDSHEHLQNVKRGKDGHGVYGMRCDTCHQAKNLTGAHMPPGNPKWSLPLPEQKMVFVERSPGELCLQLKDPRQNGGRTLAMLLDHVANDDLVGWAWNPGEGRTSPPLSRVEMVAEMKVWVEGGAACPE